MAEDGPDGSRQYRRRQKAVQRPREEWIAVPVLDSGVPREVADAAREAISENPRFSSAGHRFWELSGGVLFCGECGRRMTIHRRRKTPPRSGFYNYYRCPTRQFKGKQMCPNQKLLNAEKTEDEMWRFVSSLMQYPQRLHEGFDAMIEERRKALRGDPEREAQTWLRKLEEVDLKRKRAQDLAVQGLLDTDELRAKLAELQETRETAERELEALKGRREQIEQLERDAVIETYASIVPAALAAVTPEKRNQVYRVLRLRMSAGIDGTLEVSGEFIIPSDVFPEVCSAGQTYLYAPKSTHARGIRLHALLSEGLSKVESTPKWVETLPAVEQDPPREGSITRGAASERRP